MCACPLTFTHPLCTIECVLFTIIVNKNRNFEEICKGGQQVSVHGLLHDMPTSQWQNCSNMFKCMNPHQRQGSRISDCPPKKNNSIGCFSKCSKTTFVFVRVTKDSWHCRNSDSCPWVAREEGGWHYFGICKGQKSRLMGETTKCGTLPREATVSFPVVSLGW